ncbi:primosomal protein N' [Marinilongibacter aquaticus]|uniref:replication restart helicase PriA n=1 Tax=Marinilongibacter aquaticus TaxID=2975157 RepID=UPI0021BDE75F|nr:primosomal protein N' [Marinilongibacter aquaticus]UBM57442.1 primosomal protein N' [Marinilongibacter aquaticus]
MEDIELFQNDTVFVDVWLPVPIPGAFTYRVPRELAAEVAVGCRVIVPFGKNRVLTGIVSEVHDRPPKKYKAKYISDLMDNEPVVTDEQLWLFRWVADYYMSYAGEVMNMALPSGMKVNSESRMELNPDFEAFEHLSNEESDIVKTLQENDSLSYDDLGKYLEHSQVNKVIKSLIAKQAVIVFEQVKERYVPKKVRKIRLKSEFTHEHAVLALIEKLEKKEKQLEVLLTYLNHLPIEKLEEDNLHGIDKAFFRDAETSDSSLRTLTRNGVFEEFEVRVSRFPFNEKEQFGKVQLTEKQQEAADRIMQHFQTQQTVLFHGITGSGKTEVYIQLIQQVLDSGSQVLFMLPEIALTTQIVSRLQKVFGDKMGVYHSKFSANERVEVYMGVLKGQYQFVVGVRSSIFLPFSNLGLVIVDEEHETSYKQFDPAPRYHARDVAIMMAHKQHAKVLLGSATPSFESYWQAKAGRYGLVELHTRFGKAKLPDFIFVDMKEARKQEQVKQGFSEELIEAIAANIERKEQTIVFQNRRGYAPYLNCETCNWIGQCHQCAVTLTHHMYDNTLVCHYCGHKEAAPKVCPACSSTQLKSVGVGTEKIEEQLQEFFPSAKILRMDLDTTRSKNAYQQIINEFAEGEVDILVGTQMISKGLDFDNVSLVGIFNADKMIYFPDFRAAERAFQMITQVSGRAGRKDKPGRVLIQTGSPEHSVLQFVLNNDFPSFYAAEIGERGQFNYPPFSRIISISTKHIDRNLSHKAAGKLAEKLRSQLGAERILGPEKALVERIRNQYIFEVWVKLEKDKVNMAEVKRFIREEIVSLNTEKEFKAVRVVVNVDVL